MEKSVEPRLCLLGRLGRKPSFRGCVLADGTEAE